MDIPAHSFRIVHHAPYSPNLDPANPKEKNCYQNKGKKSNARDLKLNMFTKSGGSAELISFIDKGEFVEPEYGGVRFKDGREFAVLARRLLVPHFEEARLYFDEAKQDDVLPDDASMYDPHILQDVIDRYSTY